METFFHHDSGRWKNRIVGGPDLPNAYVDQEAAARDGRGFAEFLGSEYRVFTEPVVAVPERPAEPPQPAAARARTANGLVQALAARLDRLETGEEGETGEGEDALRVELAAQVAGQLVAAAREYAGAAHELAAEIHRTEADRLELVGEAERAALQRKAAAVDDELASSRAGDERPTPERVSFLRGPRGTGPLPATSAGPHAALSREPWRAPRGRRSSLVAVSRTRPGRRRGRPRCRPTPRPRGRRHRCSRRPPGPGPRPGS